MWRGIEYGTSPVLFPALCYNHKGIYVYGMGGYATDGSHQEVDLGISYTFSDVTLSKNDYYYPTAVGQGDTYFNFKGSETGNWFEGCLQYTPQKMPIWVLLSTYIGVGIFWLSIWTAFSKYGKIRLGNIEKPQYNNFMWGTMIFTSALAADIMFYSLSEWAMYASDSHVKAMGDMQKWVPTFPLFHWGPIAWCFHMILAVCFGFMIHIRKREKQRFSEACRPIFKDKTDGALGRIIDIIAILAILAGIATTFSLATPLLSAAICKVFSITDNIYLSITLLLIIAIIYTMAVWFGMKGTSKMAKWCMYFSSHSWDTFSS